MLVWPTEGHKHSAALPLYEPITRLEKLERQREREKGEERERQKHRQRAHRPPSFSHITGPPLNKASFTVYTQTHPITAAAQTFKTLHRRARLPPSSLLI